MKDERKYEENKMNLIIFIIICACLLFKVLVNESKGRAEGCPIRSASGWAHAVKKNPYSLAKRKSRPGVMYGRAGGSPLRALCTVNFCSVELNRRGSYSEPGVQFLTKMRFTF